jgi:hypothetical protein
MLDRLTEFRDQFVINRRRLPVDFIETLFGISPDGGDGSLEALWIGAIVVAALAIFFRKRIMAALSRRSSAR